MRKRSTKTRRHRHPVRVLQADVMSPLIAWFNFISFLRVLGKTIFVLGLLVTIAYGVRQAIRHTFHQNPDFRLQSIDLTPNSVLDEPDLVDYLDLDLSGNIFDYDIKLMEERLLRIPAISSAKVRRDLPGTLEFNVSVRQPVAWIACPQENLPASRENRSILIDRQGYTYPCPPGQVGMCQKLPIVNLSHIPGQPITVGEKLNHPQLQHCMSLLASINESFPAGVASIESISKENEWSMSLETKSGTIATFGLGEHKRQLSYLDQALNHSNKKGYKIATINLIPRQNVPITVVEDNSPPRAIPVPEQPKQSLEVSRQKNDLKSLLNRN